MIPCIKVPSYNLYGNWNFFLKTHCLHLTFCAIKHTAWRFIQNFSHFPIRSSKKTRYSICKISKMLFATYLTKEIIKTTLLRNNNLTFLPNWIPFENECEVTIGPVNSKALKFGTLAFIKSHQRWLTKNKSFIDLVTQHFFSMDFCLKVLHNSKIAHNGSHSMWPWIISCAQRFLDIIIHSFESWGMTLILQNEAKELFP